MGGSADCRCVWPLNPHATRADCFRRDEPPVSERLRCAESLSFKPAVRDVGRRVEPSRFFNLVIRVPVGPRLVYEHAHRGPQPQRRCGDRSRATGKGPPAKRIKLVWARARSPAPISVWRTRDRSGSREPPAAARSRLGILVATNPAHQRFAAGTRFRTKESCELSATA